jgi:hypothetical protein
MSSWTDLEADVNPVFVETFGDDPSIYTPAAEDPAYAITFVIGSPNPVEQNELSFLQLWAPRSAFRADPVSGDRVTLANGDVYIVFKAHADRLNDGSAGVWLSLNKA